MDYTQAAAAVLHTILIFISSYVLIPWKYNTKLTLGIIGFFISISATLVGVLVANYGVDFLVTYGYVAIGMPFYFTLYFLSTAKWFRFIFVVLTAMIFQQMIWVLLRVIRHFTGFSFAYFLLSIIFFGVFIWVNYKFRKSFHKIVFYYKNEFYILSVILAIIFGLIRIFTPVAPDGGIDFNLLMLSFIIFDLTIFIYLYISFAFKNLSKQIDLQHDTISLQHRMDEAQNQIEQLKIVQTQANIYYHDLRYHLNYLNSCMTEQNFKDGTDYIASIYEKINSDTIKYYSKNESLNLILSSYVYKAEKKNIHCEIKVTATNFERFSIPDLCSLLSNGLENALIACEQMHDSSPFISLRIFEKGTSLCIDMQNSYNKEPVFENDLPTSKEKGHGVGVKSMVYVIEKYDGIYQFWVKDGVFMFQVSIETVVDEYK